MELGSQFAVNEGKGVKLRDLAVAFFWPATYLFTLESSENCARIAAGWLLDLLLPTIGDSDQGR